MNSQLIIGSILFNSKCLGVITDTIRPAMLDDKQARDTLQAMIMMDIAGEPIELVTVASKVKDMVSPVWLTQCLDIVATAQNAEFYSKQQYEYWAVKQLKLMHAGMTFDGGLNDTLAKLSGMVTDFERDFAGKPKVSAIAGEIVTDYFTFIDGVRQGKTKILPCNMPGLTDKITPEKAIIPFYIGGLYIVIAAYSTVGKSAFIANMAAREAEAGANVVIFSNEMGRFGYAERFAGYFSGIPYGHILQNLLTDHQSQPISQGLIQFAGLPIKIYDKVRGVKEIKSTLKKLSYTQKTNLVFVDYLQNLVDKSTDVKAQLDTASKDLMQIAQDMDLTVVVASQIDNASAKGQNTNANFMAVKGSGDVSADASILVELQRDSLNSDDQVKRTIKMIVKKNRDFGRVGLREVWFDKSFTKILGAYEN